MSWNDRRNFGGNDRRPQQGGFRPSNGGQAQQQQRPGGKPVVVSPHAKGQSDNDVFASIAALGQRIEDLKLRWQETQKRIEQLRAGSGEALKQQVIQPEDSGDETNNQPLDEQA